MKKEIISCNHCGAEFEKLFETQAYRCAADIFEYKGELHLMGHYGSTTVDGMLYKVLTDQYKKGIICDDCVQKGLDAGHFECKSHSNYFGID